MATMAELQDALVNADKAGDTESARQLADAIHAMRPAPQAAAASAPLAQAPSGFAMGLGDPIHGGAQLLTKMLPDSVVKAGNSLNNWIADKTGLVAKLPEGGVDQQVRQREADYKAQRQAAGETGIDWSRIGGNVVNPVNLAIASRIPAAATLSGRMGVGALAGSGTAMLNPVGEGDFKSEKTKQAAAGAVGGAVVPAIVGGVSRLISPTSSVNPNLQLMRDSGVSPTLGQSLGGRWNALEEKAQSIPIMGDAISLARKRAMDQFNSAAINRATEPIGVKVNTIGQDGVKEAGDAISSAYDAAKSQLGNFKIDRQASSELMRLQQMTRALPDKERGAFDAAWSYLDNEVSPQGHLLADSFKRLDSKLGKDAAKFSGSNDAFQQQTGDAISELQRIVTEAAKRANPQAASALNKADQAWANLVRVEGAAKSAQNNEGIFTPAQLQSAVRQADTSVRDRATARGTALMQDLSSAGQQVLGNKIPNSFTTDRALIAGGALGSYLVYPMIPLGLIGGAAMYSQPAQSLLRGMVSSRPAGAQAVGGLLDQIAPMLAPAGGLLGYQFVNQ